MVFSTLIWWLGALAILKFVLSYVYDILFAKIDLKNYSHGSVCITGASDGIGKELAFEFLSRGFKVLLVARNKEKLETVCKELSERSKNPNVSFVVRDFSFSHRDPDTFYKDLYEEIKPHNVSILVNNVGVAHYDPFQEQSLEKIEDMIGVNIYSTVFLTKCLLPDFLSRYKETGKKSLIINISSIAAHAYAPTGSVYGATKVYIENFTKSLQYETRPAVDVSVVLPGVFETNMAQYLGVTGAQTVISLQEFASSLIQNLKTGEMSGHWKFSMQDFSNLILPESITLLLMKIFDKQVFKRLLEENLAKLNR